MKDLLSQLNQEQRLAVTYNDGPQLVIAGAGSGKTRVLTYKIAYLVQQGMKPWSILALTFTNKAANEMKQRIAQLVGQETARHIQMGTFHSIFSRILRIEADAVGYTSGFTIYDESDSRSLLKTIIKEMGLDDKVYRPAGVHAIISKAKNQLITPHDYSGRPELLNRDRNSRMPELHSVYEAYVQRCRKANAMDFDDLLVLTYRLLKEHEDIRQKYCQRFQYVLVDEYQDTNYAQQCIVWLLTKEHRHICVVGDDAQSIYGFRGANIDNILDFQQIYEGSRLFKLQQNYRSTQRIVQAANSLIKHNQRQIPKDVFSENDEGEKIIFKPVYSDKEEAFVVCKDIKRIARQENAPYSDFAILYRTNAQSRSFEEEMRKQNIPYRIYGGLSFYQRKEIKDIIAYFRLVVNPDDEEAFKRIINYPARGIGNVTIQKIADSARSHAVSFWQVISDPEQYLHGMNQGTLGKINRFKGLVEGYVLKASDTDVYQLGNEIMKTSGFIADIYSNSDPEGLARQENVEELLAGMKDFCESKKEEGRENEIYLTDYLQEVALLTDLDSDDDEESRVSLMTVHAAKGLEFPTVFIVGLEENIFPSPLSMGSMREMEEERRLLYVAITRAEKHCIMTSAKNRWRFGKMEFDTPSRFIKDIDPKLMVVESESDELGLQAAKHSGVNRRTSSGYGREYSSDVPYIGRNTWGDGEFRMNDRMQNSRPVASQFRADAKPKITAPRRAETAVDPFSASFKHRLQQAGGNLRKVSEAVCHGGRTLPEATPAAHADSLQEGSVIEHQRFGVGTVLKIEGSGENQKITVEFKNSGTKQLLIKFARFSILK